MALTVGDRDVRPLTAEEVMRMVEAGILGEDEPVELLRGALTAVSPKTPVHETVKARLIEWIAGAAPSGGYAIRVEAPIVVPDATSLPEPDVAVVRAGGDPLRHPSTALLVVEVSVTSLRVDSTIKPALYAAAGVPELWVVDVPARRMQVFGDPRPEGYASATTVEMHAAVTPSRVEAGPLELRTLFAGL